MDTEMITVRPDITIDVVLRYLRRFDGCRILPTTCLWSAAPTTFSATCR